MARRTNGRGGSWVRVAGLTLATMVAAGSAQAQNTVTEAAVYSADGSGAWSGGQHWNTNAADGNWNVFFNTSVDGTGAWVNPSATLTVPLSPGSYTWYLFGQQSFAFNFSGVDLFLNGVGSPTLSAFNAWAGDPANFASNAGQPGFNGAAGPLSVTQNGQTITIEAFSYGALGFDRVGTHTIGPNGSADYTGVLTVSVTGPVSTVPEPGTVLLVATGLLGVGVVARRRR